jgi:hypothetical protein
LLPRSSSIALSLIGKGKYAVVVPEPDGYRVERWQGEVQIAESSIGMMTVGGDNLDEVVARLIAAIKAVNTPDADNE